ncbi:hypothetical protein EV193_104166 [Herbihabitans rhizosphaerae]|uniref:Uncharacterized protein n=1 Tax=Herbihabitans rhizosphaerae TaxID=1872711 RepID=A0A4Q7KQY1_9PSEU|nr:hypothetical protein EV193_104166 [Herbihabitans rhizosphaerae]
MPGGWAAQTTSMVGTTWQNTIGGWTSQADRYADSLNASATEYERNEESAKANLRRAERPR